MPAPDRMQGVGGPAAAGPGSTKLTGLLDGMAAGQQIPHRQTLAPQPAAPAAAPAPAPAAAPAPAPSPVTPATPAVPPAAFAGVPASVFGPEKPVAVAEPQTELPAEEGEPQHQEPKAKNAWQRIKQEKKALADKVKALETEVERTKSQKPPEVEELIQLRKQIDGYEDRIGQLDITQTRAFKERFDAQIDAVARKGLQMLLRVGKEKEPAEQLLKQLLNPKVTTQQIEDLVSDQPMAVQGALMNLAVEYGDVWERRSEAVKNWKETKAALDTEASREKDIKLARNVETEAETGLQQALRDGNWLFSKANGDAPEIKTWNQQVEERVKAVRGILRSATREELAKWVFEGVTAKDTRDLFAKAQQDYQTLLTKFNQVVARSPGLGASGPVARPSDGSSAERRPQTPESLLSQMFPNP